MFDNFISLGPNCSTAYSMSKCGLRSFSGPFDWLITSDFSWILHYIEADFEDFLLQENLEPPDVLGKFKDKYSGFVFVHEEYDYHTEYNSIKQKYEKKVKNFIMACHKKTCFLRQVTGKYELEYIVGHTDYIKKVVEKYNQENSIIFLTSAEMEIPLNIPFKVYRMPPNIRSLAFLRSDWGFRSHFDGATEFLEYCWRNYSLSALISNLQFDHEKENRIIFMRYQTMVAMAAHDFSEDCFPPKIMIYGAGKLGQTLYKRIHKYTHVECFIDRSKFGREIQGVPVRSLNDLKDIGESYIIVSTTYDFQEIKASIQERCGGASIVSLNDLLRKE